MDTKTPQAPTFMPGPWLSRRYAAKAALEGKRRQESARAERHEKWLEQFKRPRSKASNRGAVEWDPIAFALGVLLGGWFTRR